MKDFLDTNILLYSIIRRPKNLKKREISEALLDRAEWAISVQVLQEFSYQAMRPSRLDALRVEQVEALVLNWLNFDVQDMTCEIVVAALRLSARYKLSYWDSAIVAAALAKGCTRLLSEDLSHGQEVEGLQIVNPFKTL